MFKASFFILNSTPFYPIRQMKPLDFHHGYAPITHPVKRLLHKEISIDIISLDNLRHFALQKAPDCATNHTRINTKESINKK